MREAVTMRFPERLLRYQKQQMQNAADAGTSALIYGGDNTHDALSAYTILVTWTLTMSGSTTINDNYSSPPAGASPVHTAVLVE